MQAADPASTTGSSQSFKQSIARTRYEYEYLFRFVESAVATVGAHDGPGRRHERLRRLAEAMGAPC